MTVSVPLNQRGRRCNICGEPIADHMNVAASPAVVRLIQSTARHPAMARAQIRAATRACPLVATGPTDVRTSASCSGQGREGGGMTRLLAKATLAATFPLRWWIRP